MYFVFKRNGEFEYHNACLIKEGLKHTGLLLKPSRFLYVYVDGSHNVYYVLHSQTEFFSLYPFNPVSPEIWKPL